MEQIMPLCDNCQTPMVLKEKNGEKFYGCPNYRECGGKTKPFGERKKFRKPENGNAIILDEIVAFRKRFEERMDDLGIYLLKKLGK